MQLRPVGQLHRAAVNMASGMLFSLVVLYLCVAKTLLAVELAV